MKFPMRPDPSVYIVMACLLIQLLPCEVTGEDESPDAKEDIEILENFEILEIFDILEEDPDSLENLEEPGDKDERTE